MSLLLGVYLKDVSSSCPGKTVEVASRELLMMRQDINEVMWDASHFTGKDLQDSRDISPDFRVKSWMYFCISLNLGGY